MTSNRSWLGVVASAAVLAGACSKTTEPGGSARPAVSVRVIEPDPTAAVGQAAPAGPSMPSASVTASRPAASLDAARYPWLSDSTVESLAAVDSLEMRLSPPPGFHRVSVKDGSFAGWLRGLPLAAPGTPVRKYSGSVLLGPDHENIAAVVAIDSGRGDLQQCADSVIRLHAEWMWSIGRRDMSYRAAAGTPLPYERWARGDRVVQKGLGIEWVASSRPSSDHAGFRKFLDTVFAWANTVSLDRQANHVPIDQVRPGDFVILPGNPGHTVIFLDLASSDDGRRVALLGQGYMPAQGIYVLRPGRSQTWFEVRPGEGAITTPFWAPFPWSSLRRLDE